MNKSMKKKKMRRLLCELLKDSKRSDRELSKVLEVSQPTASRMKNKLVKDGMIEEFTVIPDLPKMGFEILAISSFKSKRTKDIEEKAVKGTMSKPNVIFAARAEGMGKNAVVISIHKDYTDYSNFLADLMVEGEGIVEDYDALTISLKGFIAKPLSLRYITDLYEK